jgi:hypothetical protein
MAGKKPFINPLTRSSDAELHVPIATDTPTSTSPDIAATTSNPKRAKSREVVFEATHQRFTAWVDKKLKQQFDDLADQEKVSKTALLDEAMRGLLHKRERKPYTRQSQVE